MAGNSHYLKKYIIPAIITGIVTIVVALMTQSGDSSNTNPNSEVIAIGGDVNDNSGNITINQYTINVEKIEEKITEQNISDMIDPNKPVTVSDESQKTIDSLIEENEILRDQLELSGDDVSVDAEFLLKQGNYFYYTGKYQRALEFFEIILKENETNIQALNSKGLTLLKLGQYDVALEYVMKALAIDEKNNDGVSMATMYNNIGLILKAQGDLDGALEYAKRALSIFEKNNDYVSMMVLYDNIGYILQDMKKDSESQEYFQKSSDMRKQLDQ